MKETTPGIFFSAFILATCLLSGCVTKIDKSAYKDADLREGEILPSKAQLKQERAKIVVLETENRLAHSGEQSAGELFAVAIEAELNDSATEIVDRSLSKKLNNELKLAEINGVGSYTGPQVAQYAIRGQINSLDYSVKKSSQIISGVFKDKKHIPVHYDHKASIGGLIKIYELPSLRLLNSISVTGSASEDDSETVKNQSTGASLLKKAISFAISDKGHELKNFFAPKGYVVERRVNDLQSIFKVLMGHAQGAKPGDNIVFYSLKKKKANAFTGKEQPEEVRIAQGKISDNVEEGESWVIVDDKTSADKIMLGDYVKVKYSENSIFKKITR
jgi:hypothetical protein